MSSLKPYRVHNWGHGLALIVHRKSGERVGSVNHYTRGGYMAMMPSGFQRSFPTQKKAAFWLLRLFYGRRRAAARQS